MATVTEVNTPNYDRTAWFYESIAWVYSAGQIGRAKCSQLKFLEPGAKVVYLGVGAGEDALEAASRGFDVTCVELSRKMLDRFQQKLDKAGLSAELICDNAFDFDRVGQYDACMTNFFLNVFPKDQMVAMLSHAARLVRPGGKLMISDCACPQGWLPSRLFNHVYLRAGMGLYNVLGLAAWHMTYDYRKHFAEAGLTTSAVETFRYLGFGPVVFWNIIAEKQQSISPSKQFRQRAAGGAVEQSGSSRRSPA
ncbi:MAG: class I SAM-dependent methyltransferase [Pirellulales bacterium]|nr:class I SAM-dependent methyltransferase [Pirellulales bacterium]